MIVNYIEINSGRKERVLPTEVSEIAMLQFRTMLPRAAEGICELRYGTGFHLEMLTGGYRVSLYDMRGEEPVLLAVSAGVWENGQRLELWREQNRRIEKPEEEGKILKMPPSVPYIADCLLPEGEARSELASWRRNLRRDWDGQSLTRSVTVQPTELLRHPAIENRFAMGQMPTDSAFSYGSVQ